MAPRLADSSGVYQCWYRRESHRDDRVSTSLRPHRGRSASQRREHGDLRVAAPRRAANGWRSTSRQRTGRSGIEQCDRCRRTRIFGRQNHRQRRVHPGRFRQAAFGIGGPTPLTEFDPLSVTGAATLLGNIDISLINGFVPSGGNPFGVVTFASRVGGPPIGSISRDCLQRSRCWSISCPHRCASNSLRGPHRRTATAMQP